MKITLNDNEVKTLQIQEPETQADGGFQGLMIGLQRKLNASSGDLELSASELEKIPRYAFDYQNGGWQDRLVSIFGRTLGTKLGR